MTNGERIRTMNDEDLANYIFNLGNGSEYCYGHCIYDENCSCYAIEDSRCIDGIVKFLQSGMEEDLWSQRKQLVYLNGQSNK